MKFFLEDYKYRNYIVENLLGKIDKDKKRSVRDCKIRNSQVSKSIKKNDSEAMSFGRDILPKLFDGFFTSEWFEELLQIHIEWL